MRKLVLLLSLFGLGVGGPLMSQEGECGLFYAENVIFKLAAPGGWVLDCESGKSQNVIAVSYPDNETWATAETVMYINSASLKIEGQQTLASLISYDKDKFKRRIPDIHINERESILLARGEEIPVVYFGGENYGNYEAIAYIDEKEVSIMVVMSARSKKAFELSYSTFVKFVTSYQRINKPQE